MADEWTTCARCGEPQRNHSFGLCEGGNAKFVAFEDLRNALTEMRKAFRTTESVSGNHTMVFKFQDMETMHEADRQWHSWLEQLG